MTVANATICSTMSADPDFREIVELFVAEVPDRVASLTDAFDANRWADLRRIAHQLKGAAGGYGYPDLTTAASQLEFAIDASHPVEQIKEQLDGLIELAGRIAV
ncbi:MAG: Hpt domain-containing protein [Pirellulales bacterium]